MQRTPFALPLWGLVLLVFAGVFADALVPATVLMILVLAIYFSRGQSAKAHAVESMPGDAERIAELEASLVEVNATLAKASRAAGTAEIATGVLHNVGNVLNSVNVSATLAASRLKKSSEVELKRMLEIVDASGNDLAHFLATDQRGAHFYTVLKSLSESIEIEREGLSRELRAMNEGLDHIKELLRSQQSFASRNTSLERMRLETVIDQAVAISNQALTPRGIEVVRQMAADLPEFDMDGHRIMEVLVNLLQNAKQAIFGASVANGRIVVASERTPGGMARITVTDSGPGIAEDNLDLVFQHGFTTRADGHGFGLHTSANAAQEMGGSLTFENAPASKGGGARFILDLPIPADAPLPSGENGEEPRSMANPPRRTPEEQQA